MRSRLIMPTSKPKHWNLAIVCSAQRTTLNAARLARPILGTALLGRWSEAKARDRFPGARALWKVASLRRRTGSRNPQEETDPTPRRQPKWGGPSLCIYCAKEQCICRDAAPPGWTPDMRLPPSMRPEARRPTTTTCPSASAEPGSAAPGSGGEARMMRELETLFATPLQEMTSRG